MHEFIGQRFLPGGIYADQWIDVGEPQYSAVDAELELKRRVAAGLEGSVERYRIVQIVRTETI